MSRKFSNTTKYTSPTLVKASDVIESSVNRAGEYGAEILDNIKAAYPVVQETAKNLAYSSADQSKAALQYTGRQLATAAHTVGHQVRVTQRRALKLGIIYMIYKYFSKDEAVEKVVKDVEQHINNNPIQSAVIALGTGYLLAKIIR